MSTSSKSAQPQPQPQQPQSQSQSKRPFRPLMNKLYNSFGYSDSSSSSDTDSPGDKTDDSLSPMSSPEFGPVDSTKGKSSSPRQLPQCWGHRGASATFPENTLASFRQAILDGAEGIETDVHMSLDGTIIMFHDAYLNRTTNGKGLISKQQYKDGIDKLQTTKLPAQRICTFRETLDLMLEPQAKHVLLNVDVKLDNDPEVLFARMNEIVMEYENWESELAPRLILGLWHPRYLEPAERLLTYCRRAHIGVSPAVALKYFWDSCFGFSLNFSCLVTKEGEAFRRKCTQEGKELFVWTVNNRREMIAVANWGARAILTDKTADYLTLRDQMNKDWTKVSKEVDWTHSWSNLYYFTPVNALYMAWETFLLQRTAGPMLPPPATKSATSPNSVTPAVSSSTDTSV